jgi:hypothetical protein
LALRSAMEELGTSRGSDDPRCAPGQPESSPWEHGINLLPAAAMASIHGAAAPNRALTDARRGPQFGRAVALTGSNVALPLNQAGVAPA